MEVARARTVVIGSGCAGLNAADWLFDFGERDVLLVTEGMRMGTSRNTGSDKQTYYKLSLSGDDGDSPGAMAQTLLSEGVHGDTALCEAAGSARSFFKLVQLGVPFPCNEFGEYAGYRTDHDPRSRATSAGPLTSRYMTEALERQMLSKGIAIRDGWTAFHLLLRDGRVAGVVCCDRENRLHTVLCAHVVLATGGPACLYHASVYPQSQTGMTGMALLAGAPGANLHQWQYGLASVDFRWNVSGSYQQVLPRLVSVDAGGAEREFLAASLSAGDALRLSFLKGYEWPFDTRKARGSSIVDLLVHRQTTELGRRVYMDFTRNPSYLDEEFSNLDAEALTYWRRGGTAQATPMERLLAMNAPAAALYRQNGIDISREMLAVDVCAQHCNGGIAVDADWQSGIAGLYAVGEAAGTFGAYRPGGSALNAAQVGGLRAAEHIARRSGAEAPDIEAAQALLAQQPPLCVGGDIQGVGEEMQRRMSAVGAHLRDPSALRALQQEAYALLRGTVPVSAAPDDLCARVKLRDMLVTQAAVIDAMLCAAKVYGSTGAGLVLDDAGELLSTSLPYRVLPHRQQKENRVVTTRLRQGVAGGNPAFDTETTPARPLPERDTWYETVWRAHRERSGRSEG